MKSVRITELEFAKIKMEKLELDLQVFSELELELDYKGWRDRALISISINKLSEIQCNCL